MPGDAERDRGSPQLPVSLGRPPGHGTYSDGDRTPALLHTGSRPGGGEPGRAGHLSGSAGARGGGRAAGRGARGGRAAQSGPAEVRPSPDLDRARAGRGGGAVAVNENATPALTSRAQQITDIRDVARFAESLTVQLAAATTREAALAVLLGLITQGGTLRDAAAGLYVELI